MFDVINFKFNLFLYILNVSSGLIIGSRLNLDIVIMWFCVGCVVIFFNCVLLKFDLIFIFLMWILWFCIIWDGFIMLLIDEVVVRISSSWGIFLWLLFLN